MIAPHPLARLRFDDCRVPAAALIGKPGDGFKIAMATLDVFRSTVGAAALGFARRALDESLDARRRRASCSARRWPTADGAGPIADMALDVDAAALLVYRAAWTKDMRRRARHARGGDGQALRHRPRAAGHRHRPCSCTAATACARGHIVESLYREIRALRIYEGASDVQKVVIARQTLAGQG